MRIIGYQIKVSSLRFGGKINECAPGGIAVTSAIPVRLFIRGLTLIAGSLAAFSFVGHSASAETREYVISLFAPAMCNQDDDCQGGVNPGIETIYRQNLKAMGKSPDEIECIINSVNGGQSPPETKQLLSYRGRIDGKPVKVSDNPTSVPDDNLHAVVGKYAYGFNLDGKGEASPNGFEEPETHEKVINNQYFRAIGCIMAYRAYPSQAAIVWQLRWANMQETMPAWLMSIDGADFHNGGDVRVTFDRALENVLLDAAGAAMTNQTFRANPDPRFHGWRLNGGKIWTTNSPHADYAIVIANAGFKPVGAAVGTISSHMPCRSSDT